MPFQVDGVRANAKASPRVLACEAVSGGLLEGLVRCVGLLGDTKLFRDRVQLLKLLVEELLVIFGHVLVLGYAPIPAFFGHIKTDLLGEFLQFFKRNDACIGELLDEIRERPCFAYFSDSVVELLLDFLEVIGELLKEIVEDGQFFLNERVVPGPVVEKEFFDFGKLHIVFADIAKVGANRPVFEGSSFV